MSNGGNVNVKMVITEEKILGNVEKIKKMINPNSKKQIVNLEEDTYFKDLIESIKAYLTEYPKNISFPKNVYDSVYDLVEYATKQFEQNTKLIEDLIRQREKNISTSVNLKEALVKAEKKDVDWKKSVQDISEEVSQEIADLLGLIGRARSNKTESYLEALKEINTKISNLESNFHIEIDLERIEDKSNALSYIGVEIADVLKAIPTPIQIEQEDLTIEPIAEEQYIEETRVEIKPSIWERIKQMKVIRALRYLMRVRLVLELPEAVSSLPEGNEEE